MRSPRGSARRSRESPLRYSELHARGDRHPRVLVARVKLVHAADVGRPRPQERPVAARDAEQLGDHGDRQRLCDRRQQVELARAGDRIDQVVGELLHRLAHGLDHARRERLRHQSPDPGVVGRLHVEDPVRDQVPEGVERGRRRLASHLLVGGHVQVGPTEPTVPEQGADVGEPSDEPMIGGVVVHDRCGPAQAPVHGVGVGDEIRVGRVEAESERRHSGGIVVC
jgi:hypothetical protein